MANHRLPWSTVKYHGQLWTTMLVHGFDHVLLNAIMVFDHVSLWSTMVVHGRLWSISSGYVGHFQFYVRCSPVCSAYFENAALL